MFWYFHICNIYKLLIQKEMLPLELMPLATFLWCLWDFIIGLSYIYERPMLMGRLNLKMFKFGKCAHFHLICIKCTHFLKCVHFMQISWKCAHFMQIRWKCMHFHRKNVHILWKLDENVCIFNENAGKCTYFLWKTLPSRVTFIYSFLSRGKKTFWLIWLCHNEPI